MRQFFPAAWEGKLRRWNARDWDCLALLFEPPCQGVPTIPGQSSHCELLSLNPFQGKSNWTLSWSGKAPVWWSRFRLQIQCQRFWGKLLQNLIFFRQIYSRSWAYYVKRIETTFFQMSEIWLFAFLPFPNLSKNYEHECLTEPIPNSSTTRDFLFVKIKNHL